MGNKEQLLALADKFVQAGYANTDIGDDDLALLDLKQQFSFKGKKHGRTIGINGDWERFCWFIYEKLTNEPIPDCHLRGRGFRSQFYGKTVADAIRKVAGE